MKAERADIIGLVATTLMCSTPIAFLTFEFMWPNVSFPSIGMNLLVILLLSIVTGMPAGILNRRANVAIISVFLYTVLGYLLAFLFHMFPVVAYDVTLSIPGLYYAAFLRFTIVLLFLYIFGGIIGAVLGQYIRDSVGREETKVLWDKKPSS